MPRLRFFLVGGWSGPLGGGDRDQTTQGERRWDRETGMKWLSQGVSCRRKAHCAGGAARQEGGGRGRMKPSPFLAHPREACKPGVTGSPSWARILEKRHLYNLRLRTGVRITSPRGPGNGHLSSGTGSIHHGPPPAADTHSTAAASASASVSAASILPSAAFQPDPLLGTLSALDPPPTARRDRRLVARLVGGIKEHRAL